MKCLRKIVGWIPMYACYYTGELGFKICDNWPDGWSDRERWHDFIPTLAHHVYQRGMALSLVINDWAGFNLWHKEGLSGMNDGSGK